jgi:hypothetical protein
VEEGKYGENILYSCKKMEKWDLLKLLQECGEGGKGEWWRGWIQLWHIVRTFVNVTMHSQYNHNKKKKERNYLCLWLYTSNPSSVHNNCAVIIAFTNGKHKEQYALSFTSTVEIVIQPCVWSWKMIIDILLLFQKETVPSINRGDDLDESK